MDRSDLGSDRYKYKVSQLSLRSRLFLSSLSRFARSLSTATYFVIQWLRARSLQRQRRRFSASLLPNPWVLPQRFTPKLQHGSAQRRAGARARTRRWSSTLPRIPSTKRTTRPKIAATGAAVPMRQHAQTKLRAPKTASWKAFRAMPTMELRPKAAPSPWICTARTAFRARVYISSPRTRRSMR